MRALPRLRRYAALSPGQRRRLRAVCPTHPGVADARAEADLTLRWGAFVHPGGAVSPLARRLDRFLYAVRCLCDVGPEDGPWWADVADLARVARDKYCFNRLACGPYLAALADCADDGGGDALRAITGCVRTELSGRRHAPLSHVKLLYGRTQNGAATPDDGYVLRLERKKP